jgi:hypothetical protein
VTDHDASILQRVARRIIRITIRDLRRGHVDAVKPYLESATFSLHLNLAGYPQELHDTLLDAVLCSEVHRRKTCEEVERLLKQLDNKKKAPTKAGASQGVSPTK